MNSDSNNYIKHFFTIGWGTFIYLIIGFITVPVLTRLYNPEIYGQFSLFNTYSGISVMILCLGMDQALVRWYYVDNDIRYKRALLFECIRLPAIVSAVIIVSLLLYFIGMRSIPATKELILLFVVNVVFQILYRFSILIIRLEYLSKLYSMLNILQCSSFLLLTVCAALMINKDDMFSLSAARVISCVICVIFSMLCQRNIWNLRKNQKQYCLINYKEIFIYAFPYVFSLGITTIFQAIDKISLNHFCTYKDVGIYSSALTLIHVFDIVQITFNTIWTPMAIEHFTKDKTDKSFYQQGNHIITVIMFFIGFSVILFKDLFFLILGEKYRDAAYIMPFLIFYPIMYTVSETTVKGLVFMKKSSMQILVALGACIFNILGNFFLIPIVGPKGAAISTGLSYIVFFTLRTVFSNIYYPIDFKLGKYYFITFIFALYAIYNTFYQFNLITVLGYILSIVFTYALYRDTVKEIIKKIVAYRKKLP